MVSKKKTENVYRADPVLQDILQLENIYSGWSLKGGGLFLSLPSWSCFIDIRLRQSQSTLHFRQSLLWLCLTLLLRFRNLLLLILSRSRGTLAAAAGGWQ